MILSEPSLEVHEFHLTASAIDTPHLAATDISTPQKSTLEARQSCDFKEHPKAGPPLLFHPLRSLHPQVPSEHHLS